MKLTKIIIAISMLLAVQFSNIVAQTSTETDKSKAELKIESNIIGNVYQADYSKSKIFYPSDLANAVPKAIVVKGDERTKTLFDSLIDAKEFSKKNYQANVIIFDKKTKKYSLYELIIGENSAVAVQFAESSLRNTLKSKPIIPLTYEALKISSDYSLQLLPPMKELKWSWWEVADIVDAEGLSLIKKTNMQLMAGSKGIRLLFDSELEKSNFDEALKIYQWLEKININSNDLDVVKITRKTNLSKMFQTSAKLRPFVEAEMEKWKYAVADRKAVRGNIPKANDEDEDAFSSFNEVIANLPDGECLSGNCVNGRGKMVYASGDTYEGDFVNDKKEGKGTYTYKNGDYYTGEYKNDKQNGYGKQFTKATNTTREGNWKDGFLIASTTSTTSTTTPVVAKTGSLADCKIVLSEGCRNYLLQAKAADILPQVTDAFIFEGNKLVSNIFGAELVEGTGGVLSASFIESKSRPNKPAENLKWGESVESVKKKYGEPLQIRSDTNRATHSYKDFQFGYVNNKLGSVKFSRDKTESEIAAEQIFNREKLEAERIANTPENRAKKFKADAIAAYYETVEQCNRIMGYYNDKVEQGNRQTTREARVLVDSWNSAKTAKAVANMKARLQSLLDIHGANLPADMKQQIEAQLKSLN